MKMLSGSSHSNLSLSHTHSGYSQTLRETNSLQRTAWDSGECSLLHRHIQGSLLFNQGLQPTFVKTLHALSVHAQAHIPKFLRLSLENVKGRYNQATAIFHNQKSQLVMPCKLHQWVA